MSVYIIKKTHPLYEFWKWYYTIDWIGRDGATIEGVDLYKAYKPHRRTQPIPKRAYHKVAELPVGMKYCSKCRRLLSVENFYKHTEKGYQRYCKECQRTAQNEHYRKKMAEKIARGELPAKRERKVVTERVCRKCGQLLPISEFYLKDKGCAYQYNCKKCDKKRRKELYRQKAISVVMLEPHTNEEIKVVPSENMIRWKREEVYYGDDLGRAE